MAVILGHNYLVHTFTFLRTTSGILAATQTKRTPNCTPLYILHIKEYKMRLRFAPASASAGTNRSEFIMGIVTHFEQVQIWSYSEGDFDKGLNDSIPTYLN
jgi:hypothetical protein